MWKMLPIQVWMAAYARGGCGSICPISAVYNQNLSVALDLVGQPNKMKKMTYQSDG